MTRKHEYPPNVQASRRDWLRTIAVHTTVFALGITCARNVRSAGTDDPPARKPAAPGDPTWTKTEPPDNPNAVASTLAHAKKVGLDDLAARKSTHYHLIGNAQPAFLAQASTICERLLIDYDAHFSGKGFVLRPPQAKMILVALANRNNFTAFLGQDLGPVVGGIYDLDANRLVIFDNRPEGDAAAASAERINTFTLAHESLHQLAFNTGLLELHGDVPLCISEGLAMYGEQRSAKNPAPMGRTNAPRLQGLKQGRAQGTPWIPLEQLIRNDQYLLNPDTQQPAYAQSWVFVQYCLQNKSWTPKFQKYLESIRSRKTADPDQRAADAANALGDLKTLDKNLKSAADRALRSIR